MKQANVEHRYKVSFIIPVYNVAKYLRRCLDSVVKQTLSEVEIICVDDASTDDSWKILQEYMSKDNRIKVVHSYDGCVTKCNRGLSATRNCGLALAQGEYVLFLDSDDWLELDAAERLYNLAHREDLDVLCYDFVAEYETEELREKFPLDLRRGFCTEKALSGQEIFWRQELCHGYYSMAPLLLCRRSYLCATKQEWCFYEGIEHEDLIFGLETLVAAPRAASVEWKLYHYWRREQSITTKDMSLLKAESFFIILYEQLKFLGSQKLSTETAISAGRMFYDTFYWFLTGMYYPHHDEICTKARFTSPEHQQAFVFFRQVCEPFFQSYTPPLHRLNEQELDILRKAEQIIIYGAGGIGRRVADYISKLGFDEFIFAVTENVGKSNFMGSPIHVISEEGLVDENVAVLVSVMTDKQAEMMRTLETLKAKHVICMMD